MKKTTRTTNTNHFHHVVKSVNLNYDKIIYNLNPLPAFKDQDSAMDLCNYLLEKYLESTTSKAKESFCRAFGVAVTYFDKTKIFDRYNAKIYNEEYASLCNGTHCDEEIAEVKDITSLLIKKQKIPTFPYPAIV